MLYPSKVVRVLSSRRRSLVLRPETQRGGVYGADLRCARVLYFVYDGFEAIAGVTCVFT